MSLLLRAAGLSRSTYYFEIRPHGVDGSEANRLILAEIRAIWEGSGRRYGVRKVWAELWNRRIAVNYKKVARIMRKNGIRGVGRKGPGRYSSYRGEVGKVAPNLVERDFRARRPNEKWATDVTEFACPFGKAYLSPIKDMFDSSIVAWDLSLHPDFAQAMRMLGSAFAANPNLEGLILHSDQGWQYQMPQWRARLEAKGIRQSMSRKGNCLDNGIMESFFGTMKAEMFVGREAEFETFEDLRDAVAEYIRWYNESRIMEKTKWMPPLGFRKASIAAPGK